MRCVNLQGTVYASMGIVVNRDNPVKRVKDKYLFISMSIF